VTGREKLSTKRAPQGKKVGRHRGKWRDHVRGPVVGKGHKKPKTHGNDAFQVQGECETSSERVSKRRVEGQRALVKVCGAYAEEHFEEAKEKNRKKGPRRFRGQKPFWGRRKEQARHIPEGSEGVLRVGSSQDGKNRRVTGPLIYKKNEKKMKSKGGGHASKTERGERRGAWC